MRCPRPSSTSAAQLRDAELDAARARIADLEARVGLLQRQLESKEATIRRLSEAALRSSTARLTATPSSGPASSSSPHHQQQQQPRAVVQHSGITDFILSLGGGSSTTAGAAGRDPSAVTLDTLRLHDERCHQLLSASPFVAKPLADP